MKLNKNATEDLRSTVTRLLIDNKASTIMGHVIYQDLGRKLLRKATFSQKKLDSISWRILLQLVKLYEKRYLRQ